VLYLDALCKQSGKVPPYSTLMPLLTYRKFLHFFSLINLLELAASDLVNIIPVQHTPILLDFIRL